MNAQRRSGHIFRFAAITLFALAWSSHAFCDAIHDAAQSGDLEKLKALLKSNPGFVFSKEEKYGDTPLHKATGKGCKSVVEFLLANKADVDATNNDGYTPLHVAAYQGNKDIVEVLLANRANVNARDNYGQTALFWAAGSDHRDIAELLLASGADINAKKNIGLSPLAMAAMKGFSDLVELLLTNKAEVNVKDNNGMTPLFLAAMKGHTEVAEKLLASKADVNAGDQDGVTPLQIAANNGYKDLASLLLAHKADVNARAKDGETPLHSIALTGNRNLAELLLANGADVAAKDNNGDTPFALALRHGNLDLAHFLRQRERQEAAVASTRPDSTTTVQVTNVERPSARTSSPEIEALVNKIRNGDFRTRFDAATALEGMGSNAVPAIPALIDELDDNRSIVSEKWTDLTNGDTIIRRTTLAEEVTPRYAANKALHQIVPFANGFGFEYACERFRSDATETGVGYTAGVLVCYGDKAVPVLIDGLKSARTDTPHGLSREAIGNALSKLGQAATQPLIELAATDSDNSYGAQLVREVAFEALGRIRDPEAVPILIMALSDERFYIRQKAARSLGLIAEMGDSRVYNARVYDSLAGAVRDTNAFVRDAAADALTIIKGTAPPTNWPSYTIALSDSTGSHEVRVKNPNDFKVRVGLRSNGKGKDFIVQPKRTRSVRVPNGRYDIYFNYLNDSTGLYQGDSFTLERNGVAITLTKVANGNYGIHRLAPYMEHGPQ